jgi:hypothetical protein
VRPPPFGVVYAGGGPGPTPPPFGVICGVIRGAVVVGWGFYLAVGKEVETWEKLLKKGRQKFSGRNLWRLVSVLKKVVRCFDRPPPFQIRHWAYCKSIPYKNCSMP